MDITSTLKLCSWILVLSLANVIRYFLLKRQLARAFKENARDISKALRGQPLRFSSFFKEPLETEDDALDLVLFKIHRSTVWSISLMCFYILSVVFILLVKAKMKP